MNALSAAELVHAWERGLSHSAVDRALLLLAAACPELSSDVLAHLSIGGVRTMHVYVDSTAGLLPSVKGLARSWGEGRATVHDMHDPGWHAVAHLRQ